MSDLRVMAQQLNVGRVVDSQWASLRGTRDGSPIVVPWLQALVLEGRVFQALGPERLTVAFTPMTLLRLVDQADTSAALYVDIPDGTACLPLKAWVSFRATGAAIVAADGTLSDSLIGTAGTETATTIRNYHRGSPVPSAGTAGHTATAEADHVTGAEIVLFQFDTSFRKLSPRQRSPPSTRGSGGHVN